jgi:tryptophanyl-tRNA synthetase
MDIYRAFASDEQVAEMRQAYRDGIAWGTAKQIIFETLNTELQQVRQNYEDLMANPAKIDEELQKGAAKARQSAKPFLAQLKDAVGIRPIV